MSRLPIALVFMLACTSSPGNEPATTSHPVCGDGVCDAVEVHTCPADCGMGGSGSAATVCGNGVCETGENATNCPADCTVTMCGNGVCETGENSSNCPEDCGSNVGTFDCTTQETQDNCMFCFEDDADGGLGTCDAFGDAYPGTANDCAMCVANGNFGSACVSACGGGETLACAQCETVAAECGDGFCEFQDGENEMNCPTDCPPVPCGDGICDVQNGETSATCSADCLLTNSFDCSSATNQNNCGTCFFDDSNTLGSCTTATDVPGGTPGDCSKCASIGAFGPDCEPYCSAVESGACATCVADGL